MFTIKIIETSAGQLFRVEEYGDPDLAHVWRGIRVKRSKGSFVDCIGNNKPVMVRKAACRSVEK